MLITIADKKWCPDKCLTIYGLFLLFRKETWTLLAQLAATTVAGDTDASTHGCNPLSNFQKNKIK